MFNHLKFCICETVYDMVISLSFQEERLRADREMIEERLRANRERIEEREGRRHEV